jgi:predicted nucleotide-binding protein (sugar kinase/HSP70/actin superfamily)
VMSVPIPLREKKLWIFPMTYGGARALAAVWRAHGVDAEVIPPSDDDTLALGARHTAGDECLPQRITLGDLLKIARRPDYSPERTAIFFATTSGPCRFGQYIALFRKAFREEGLGELQVVAPNSDDSYQSVGRECPDLVRLAWWAVVGSDLLQKGLHRIRPYERTPRASDRVYLEGLDAFCRVIERGAPSRRRHLAALVDCLGETCGRFARIPILEESRPLIGVVGEIFCRLNTFSNQDLIRRLEHCGGEAWLSDVGEWVWYCNESEAQELAMRGRRLSFAMLGVRLRGRVQRGDEHALWLPFRDLLKGREEPESPEDLLANARPYLPAEGVSGEMVLSVGKAVHLWAHGAHGVIDISPFTCMNGIVSEAIYPRLSRDLGGLPVKNFYFDGKPTALDRDLEIFLELARGYRTRSERRPASQRILRPALGASSDFSPSSKRPT